MKIKTEILMTLLAFTVSSGNYSCIKNKKRHLYTFSQEFKDYTLFKANSWWVYRLEGGSTTDSVYVFQSDVGVATPNHLSYNYESYVIQSRSVFLGENIIQSGVAGTPDVYDSDFQRLTYATSLGADIVSYFSNKNTGYKFLLFPSHETLYKESLAAVTINTVTYNNVKVFEAIKASSTDQRLPKLVYFAPNIGIVKKELYNGQVWNLVKHQVIQ